MSFNAATRLKSRPMTSISKVISACGKCQQLYKGLLLLEEMEEREIEPTVVTFNSLIAFTTWASALNLLEEMGTRRLFGDVYSRNGALKACEGSKLWPEALLLLRELVEESCGDLITCAEEVLTKIFVAILAVFTI